MRKYGFVLGRSAIKLCHIPALSRPWTPRSLGFRTAFVLLSAASALLCCSRLNAGVVSNATTGVTYPTLKAGLQEVASNQQLVLSADAFTEDGVVITNDWVTLSGQGRGTTLVQAADDADSATSGVFVVRGDHVVIERMTIRYGRSPGHGGGVWNASTGSVFIQDCEVANNTADASGGGAYNCLLSRSEVWGNRASQGLWAGAGGGVCYGTLSNCAVWANFSLMGGGSYESALVNCTLTGNQALEAGGGALRGTAVNCILWGNSVLIQQDADWCGGASDIRYSCAPLLTGTGNISDDPRLTSASHLSARSPCIGRGEPGSAAGSDIDGEVWTERPSMGCDRYVAGAATGNVSVGIDTPFTQVVRSSALEFSGRIFGRVTRSVWSFGDGNVLSNTLTAAHAWPDTGTYALTLTAYNETYPDGVATSIQVHVVEQPTHYVNVSNAVPQVPYTNWATAATTIQDAITAVQVAGAQVLVTNGVYESGGAVGPENGVSNRLFVSRFVHVRSVNGPSATTVRGLGWQVGTNQGAAVRCAYVDDHATLSGFTLTEGYSGGLVLAPTGVASNCNVTACWGHGVYGGTLIKGVLANNTSGGWGGGAAFSTLRECRIIDNYGDTGGGAYVCSLYNCLVSGNESYYGEGGGAAYSSLFNCTVVSNWITGSYWGSGGTAGCEVYNSIVVGNFSYDAIGDSYLSDANDTLFHASCSSAATGPGNITASPRFTEEAGGDYRLAPDSPCIDSGMDLSAKGVACDIDGLSRPLDGNHDGVLAFDIGAYECGVAGSPIRIPTVNPLPEGTVSAAYSQPLTAEGGAAPYIWSVVAGALPSGLDLAVTNGLVEGTPAETTVAHFRVRVTDAEDSYADRDFMLTVGIAPLRADVAYAFTNFVGQPDFMGAEDGAGTNAWFSQPSGVAGDAAGNLYVADTMNGTIRKVTSDGTVTTLAGTAGFSGSADGTGAEAQFSWPTAVAVDGDGNVYVADTQNSAIRKVTPEGVVTTLAGNKMSPGYADGTGAAAQFSQPMGLAVDGAGNVYVADTFNSLIRKVTPEGVVTTVAGSIEGGMMGHENPDGIGTNAWFSMPYGLAVDAAGNVYVADTGNGTIRKMTCAGVVTTLAGRTGFYGSADGTGSVARFNLPYGVAVDGTGCLYVTDSFSNHTIRKVTPAGVVTTIGGSAGVSGSADGIGSLARFSQPCGITVDSAKRLYVADGYNCRISRGTPFYPPPTITTPSTLPPAKSERTCRLPLTAVGGTSPYTWDLVSGSLPAGLYLGDDGVIGGMPVAPTNMSFTVRVTGGDGLSSSLTFSLTIILPDAPTILTLSPLPAGVVGTDYRLTLSARSGTWPYTWSIAAGALPSGLTLKAAGVISGTPQTPVEGVFRLRVTGADGLYSERDYNLTVEEGGLVGASYSWVNFAGWPGNTGNADGVGTNASFNSPVAVAADGDGNVYVADSMSYTIRKVTPVGVVSTLAGSAEGYGSADGTGAAAQFSQPCGLAADSGGNVYVADTYNNTIRKVTPAGVVTTLAGNALVTPGSVDGTGSAARFRYPQGVAVDSAGTVYVADTVNNTIRKVTTEGVVSTLAGSAGAWGYTDGTGSVARFSNPTGVAVDSAGDVYVADAGNAVIRKVTPVGAVTTLAGNTLGYFGEDNGDGLGSSASFGQPCAVAVDVRGNLYVADSLFDTIRKVTQAGLVTTIGGMATMPGCADGTGTVARFNTPTGVAVDRAGHIYVADTWNNRISKGSPSGLPPTIVTPSSLPPGMVGVAYSQTLAAIDGIPPYTWDCTSGSLPPLLTLNGGGVIGGKPTEDTNAAITVRVTDGGGRSSTKAFTLVIGGRPSLSLFLANDRLSFAWSTDCLGWELQMATNLSIGAQWIPVSGSTTSTLMSVTVDPGVPAAFYRLHRLE